MDAQRLINAKNSGDAVEHAGFKQKIFLTVCWGQIDVSNIHENDDAKRCEKIVKKWHHCITVNFMTAVWNIPCISFHSHHSRPRITCLFSLFRLFYSPSQFREFSRNVGPMLNVQPPSIHSKCSSLLFPATQKWIRLLAHVTAVAATDQSGNCSCL